MMETNMPTPTLRFNRKVLSTAISYLVFPKGIPYATAEEALANKGTGYVREYTTIVSSIDITTEQGEHNQAQATKLSSKDIHSVADATPLPTPDEEDLPF